MEIRYTTQPPGSVREEATFDVSIAFYENNALATTANGPLPSDVSCALKLSDGSTETTIETDTISDTSKHEFTLPIRYILEKQIFFQLVLLHLMVFL